MIKSFIERIAREVFWEEARTYDRTVADIARRAVIEQSVGDVPVMLDEGQTELPSRAHATDAGADLRCMEGFTVMPGDSELVDTGVHVELPEGTAGMLKSKSRHNCNVCVQTEGVIDQSYRGSIRVRVYNHGTYPITFEKGDAITQLVIVRVLCPGFYQAESLSETDRGSGGFGSTGR